MRILFRPQVILIAAIAAVAALGSSPALAQSGDITATVTVKNIAVSVAPSTVDYGTLTFEATNKVGTAGAPQFTATNDGNVAEDFGVKGVDASGTGIAWTLTAGPRSCPGSGTDAFSHSVFGVSTGPVEDGEIVLSTSSQPLETGVGAAGTKDFNSKLYMPCSGSGGTGETATTTITVLATES